MKRNLDKPTGPCTSLRAAWSGVRRHPIKLGFNDLLAESGLSQRDLAERLGVSKTTVSNWATGKFEVQPAAVAWLRLYTELQALVRK